MEAKISAANRLPQGQRTEGLTAVLSELLADQRSASFADDTIALVRAVVQDASPVVSQQVISDFVKRVAGVEDADVRKVVIQGSLAALQERLVSFQEQVTALRETLANLFETEEEWSEAAKTLIGIPMDSGHRSVSDDYKLSTYIRIVRLYIEDDDAVSAESYFTRASGLIRTTDDREKQLQYRLCQARIFDSQRRFNEAAAKYHELSYEVAIDESERSQMLSAAVTCAILGPAGPQRSRLLATLYRDDRSAELPHYQMLAATFLDHIISPEQVESFARDLQPHQLAKLSSAGFIAPAGDKATTVPTAARPVKHAPETVLDRAVMEHNLLAASRIYSNITFEGLGVLLSLTPHAAEAMARTMIQQGRLKGSLDQIERLITFDAAEREIEGAVSNVAAASESVTSEHDIVIAPETMRWDRQIRTAAQSVEDLAVRIEALTSQAVSA